MDFIDTCVIGGGVIGLAIARALAAAVPEVLVVDQATSIGQGISSRNSEVIHAGIYYPSDSLKARLCIEGGRQLYEYCQSHGVAHQRCGKLIVATDVTEEAALSDVQQLAWVNGVDLSIWSGSQVTDAQAHIRASMALFSPTTGIVSAHDLMHSLLSDLEQRGGSFVGSTRVEAIDAVDDGFVVLCQVNGADYRFGCRSVINAAGLGAQVLAASCTGLDPAHIPPLYLCKGLYFSLTGKHHFKHLIYPVPEASGAGLGVHATLDLGGRVKFGPNVEYVDTADYSVPEASREGYFQAIRRYYPQIEKARLVPDYAGIRPKLQAPGGSPADFVIQGPSVHGLTGLVNLFGMESPGLTAALAIADYVHTDILGYTNYEPQR